MAKRKRKRQAKAFARQKVVVSVKPRYFGSDGGELRGGVAPSQPYMDGSRNPAVSPPSANDTMVQVIEGMLPPLVPPIFDAFGRNCQYCGGQLQSDSGDFLLFFKTRWRTYRQGLTLLSEDRHNAPIVIFSCVPENETTDFMGTYGYDIQWDRIVEIAYQDFTDFLVRACAISIEKWLQDNSPDRGEKVGVHGDMKWIPPHVRAAILKTGRFSSVEASFNFPKTPKWEEKVAQFATDKS